MGAQGQKSLSGNRSNQPGQTQTRNRRGASKNLFDEKTMKYKREKNLISRDNKLN